MELPVSAPESCITGGALRGCPEPGASAGSGVTGLGGGAGGAMSAGGRLMPASMLRRPYLVT